MSVEYGYCRVSTPKQKIDRQIVNVKEAFPDAVIITEAYSGTTLDRPAWSKLIKHIKPGDTIIFDEVSRMSRNAADGFSIYQDLYNRGVELIFLKERYIDTAVYRTAAQKRIEATISTGNTATDTFTNTILEAVNTLLMDLARDQIAAAFRQAQAEVDHLHRRTSEGVRRAQAAGKQVGRMKGAKITTEKERAAREIIKRHNIDFGGSLSDAETIKLAGVSRNTYYKYKRAIRAGTC